MFKQIVKSLYTTYNLQYEIKVCCVLMFFFFIRVFFEVMVLPEYSLLDVILQVAFLFIDNHFIQDSIAYSLNNVFSNP